MVEWKGGARTVRRDVTLEGAFDGNPTQEDLAIVEGKEGSQARLT